MKDFSTSVKLVKSPGVISGLIKHVELSINLGKKVVLSK